MVVLFFVFLVAMLMMAMLMMTMLMLFFMFLVVMIMVAVSMVGWRKERATVRRVLERTAKNDVTRRDSPESPR